MRVRLRLRARVAPVQVQTRGVVRVVGGAGGCSLLSLLLRLCLGMGSVVAHARKAAAPALHACNAHVPPPAPRVLCEMPGHRAWDGNEGTVRAGTDEGLVLAQSDGSFGSLTCAASGRGRRFISPQRDGLPSRA